MMKVGITGGIGSGKKHRLPFVRGAGVAVYDSDTEARRLMTGSEELRQAIAARFGRTSTAAVRSTAPVWPGWSSPTGRRWPISMRWCIPLSWPISPPGPNGRRVIT